MVDEILKKIKEYLGNKVEFAYAFGSVLKENEFFESSDVDIGIFSINTNKSNFIQWKDELENILNREVDLVKLDLNDPIISMQIIANGQLLFANNPKSEIEFRAQLYSRYIDFKQSRREIEKNLAKGMNRYVRK